MTNSNFEKRTIAVLGAGSWGTALALHLARLSHAVNLWSYQKDHLAEMQKDRCNKHYLPEHPFPDNLIPVIELSNALHDVKDIVIAVPSIGFRDTLNQLQPLLNKNHRIIWATKGLDLTSGKLLDDVAREILGTQISLAVISGPSFAKEVANQLPTAVVVASHDIEFANDMVNCFMSPAFRVYRSEDVRGVEIGGVVKNVLAIAVGISDGMGFGANAKSALITRGLAEITRLGLALDCQLETFMGLTGVGDLVLTCTDNQSRNRRFGLALGQGKSVEAATKDIGQVIEGQRSAELILPLAAKYHVDMPISKAVLAIIQGKITPAEAMHELLTRESKHE